MRRALITLTTVLLAAIGLPGAQAQVGPGIGPGFLSPNVSWVATIPIDSPGIGGRVVKVGDQIRFYVSAVHGLSIYDITNPGIPLLMGFLPLPNWENEDIEVSADGNTAFMANDFTNSYVIDTSIPAVPRMVSMFAGQHTVSCAVPSCDWVYGSEGQIFDMRNRAAPVRVANRWDFDPATGGFLGGGHDLNSV